MGSITGTVYDSLSTHAPLANATVVLVELSHYTTTDARGSFHFDKVPDGRYTLGFTHAILDSLDLELPVVAVDVAGASKSVALATPSQATVYARLCPGPRDTDTGVIMGRVHDVDDHTPLADATVSTDWTEYTLGGGGRPAAHRVRDAVRTNSGGVYFLCGVPTGVPLEVLTELAGFGAGPLLRSLDTRLLERADFALSRRDSAARVAAGDSTHDASRDTSRDVSRDTAHVRGTATLRGTVVGADGRPVREATVDVLGTQRSARTDAAGKFRLENIPAGTRSIEVKAIGLSPMTAAMDFATNGARDTTVTIDRTALALGADTVKGRARTPSPIEDNGFETRRKQALGTYVTEDQINRHAYQDLSAVLRGIGDIRVDCNAQKAGLQGVRCLPMPKMMGIADFNGNYCTPNFFVDGVPFPVATTAQFGDLANMARPGVIRGIEVYANPGTIPAQFDLTSSTGCGSIVIWTR